MVKSISASLATQINRNVGAEPAWFLSIRRKNVSPFVSGNSPLVGRYFVDPGTTTESPFRFGKQTGSSFADWHSFFGSPGLGGAASDTTFSATDGEAITMSGAVLHAAWESSAIDSKFTTPEVIWPKINWAETGTVAAFFRSATSAAGLSSQSYTTVTKNTLDNTFRERWGQIKFTLDRATSVNTSPTIKGITMAVKAVLPGSNLMNPLPSLYSAVGKDLLSPGGGSDSNFRLDGRGRQWDELFAGSYSTNRNILKDYFELWVGMKLPDSGRREYVQVYSGRLHSLSFSGTTPRNTDIYTRNPILDKLGQTILGTPTATGTPNPYHSGTRFREPLIETDNTNFEWTLYSNRNPVFITAVYEGTEKISLAAGRNTIQRAPNAEPFKGESGISSIWEPTDLGYSISGKKVFFTAPVANQVTVDVTFEGNVNHPIDIIKDILITQVGLESFQIDSTNIDAIKTDTAGMAVGVRFENMSALDAITRLCRSMDAFFFIDGEQFTIRRYQSLTASGLNFSDSDYGGFSVSKDQIAIINSGIVPFGNYNEDREKAATVIDDASAQDYGAQRLTDQYPDFSYTYQDPISMDAKADVDVFLGSAIGRMADPKRIYSVSNVSLKALRLELGDRITLTNAFLVITNRPAIVLEKNLNLDARSIDLKLLEAMPIPAATVTAQISPSVAAATNTGAWSRYGSTPLHMDSQWNLTFRYLNPSGSIYALRTMCLTPDTATPSINTPTGQQGDQTAISTNGRTEFYRDFRDCQNLDDAGYVNADGYGYDAKEDTWNFSAGHGSTYTPALHISAADGAGTDRTTRFTATYTNSRGNAPTNRINNLPPDKYYVWAFSLGGSDSQSDDAHQDRIPNEG
jgi:hypothetical protein